MFGIIGSAWSVYGLFELENSAEDSWLEASANATDGAYSFFKLLYAM
jgi:hypothetical protein